MQKEIDGLFVMGIGTSVGGVDALGSLLAHLPQSEKVVYIVAKYQGMTHSEQLVSLLSSSTDKKIVDVTSDQGLHSGTIYILPPDHLVSFESDQLILEKGASEGNDVTPSIDHFFTSLADAYGERAIGIILSGTGMDGVQGMRAIKAVGGITAVQDPDSAGHPELPRSIIDSVDIDLVVSPDAMGSAVFNIVENAFLQSTQHLDMSGEAMRELLAKLHQQTGCDFSQYKEATLHRRISRRLSLQCFTDLPSYISYVEKHPGELDLLAREMLISVTEFFRDMEAFDALKGVLPELLQRNSSDPVRVWVPGCASGEEVYSIAILIDMFQQKHETNRQVQFFATDIDFQSVNRARKGLYSKSSVMYLDRAIAERYFQEESGMYSVIKSIREMIVFARQDIITDPPFSRIDLIVCRNLLIYFNSALQSRLMAMFHFSLNTGGILFLGKSESLGQTNGLFTPISKKWRIFKRKTSDRRYVSAFRRRPVSRFQWKYGENRSMDNKKASFREVIHRAVSDAFGFPSVLINDRLELLFVRGDIDRFFRIGEGSVGLNVYELAKGEIRSHLRSAINKAVRSGVAVVSRGIPLDIQSMDEKKREFVTLHVRPVSYPDAPEGTLLLSFEPESKADAIALDIPVVGDVRDQHIMELEQELAATRERLQNTVEELETANEELHSLNEELQSINEEMETSNEELQAYNEELITVNEELQQKSGALSRALDDGKKAEAELLRRKQLFKAIVDHVPVLITFHDVDGTIRLVNKAFEYAVGWRREHLEAIDIFEKCYPDPLYRQEVMEHMQKPGVQWKEFTLATRKETTMDTVWSSVHLEDGSWIAIGLDVTEKKKLETILGRKQKLESLGNLAGGIAHDFNNCLASIIGFAELSLDLNMEGEDCGSELTQVIKSGMRARDLVRRILTFSQKAPFKKEPVSMKSVAEEAVKMLRPTLPNSVEIESHFPENEMILLADPSHMHQIVMNLCTNAARAIEESGRKGVIKVGVNPISASELKKQTSTSIERGDYIWLTVSDTGTGISDEILDKLFDPYFSTRPSCEGAGLGLSVVHGIVKSLKGAIEVNSKKGGGTTFHVYLPMMEMRESEKEALPISQADHSMKAGTGACKTILFVDDEVSITRLQNTMLTRLGYNVFTFTDSVEALAFFNEASHRIDLVITDMEMPKMKGDELTSKIKKIRSDVPVILCTGHSEKLHCFQKRNSCFEACLMKPVEKKEISEMIQKVLDAAL